MVYCNIVVVYCNIAYYVTLSHLLFVSASLCGTVGGVIFSEGCGIVGWDKWDVTSELLQYYTIL